MVKKKNFKFIRGDSFMYFFSLPKPQYTDITQIYYTVKTQVDGKALLSKSLDNDIYLTHEDDEKLHYMIIFNATDTDKLKIGAKYIHDIEVLIDTYKETVMNGNFILNSEVTKTRNEV